MFRLSKRQQRRFLDKVIRTPPKLLLKNFSYDLVPRRRRQLLSICLSQFPVARFAVRHYTTNTNPGHKPELPNSPLNFEYLKERATAEYFMNKANRDEIRKNIWRADDPVDKISELLKLYPELSDFLDEKSLPTGFENILGNARPKFESVPEAEMHREVTPEVKANIEKFVNAVLEFVALEKILTTYPDCEATRKILRLYLKPGASDEMQPIDAPIEESPYDFTQTRTELISNSMRAFIPSLCKGLEEWYKSRPNTPHDISDIDMSVISQSTATSMLLGEWLAAYLIDSGFPSEDVKVIYQILKRADHQSYLRAHLHFEQTKFEAIRMVADQLKDHASYQERLEWYKEYCQEVDTLTESLREVLGPDGLSFIKFKQKQFERHEHLSPKFGDDIIRPVQGRKQPDHPGELASVLALGYFLDSQQPKEELEALMQVNSWEGLWAWHAVYRQTPQKLVPDAALRREIATLRRELHQLIRDKFSALRELALQLDYFRVYPTQRMFYNAIRLQYHMLVDLTFFYTLPIRENHKSALSTHEDYVIGDIKKLSRKIQIELLQHNAQAEYIPRDTTGENVYGHIPYDDATTELPAHYEIPGRPGAYRVLRDVRINLDGDEPEWNRMKWKAMFIDPYKKRVKRVLKFPLLLLVIGAVLLVYTLSLIFDILLGDNANASLRLANTLTRLGLYAFAIADRLLTLMALCIHVPTWLALLLIVSPGYRALTEPVRTYEEQVELYNQALHTLELKLMVDRAIFERKMLAELTEEESERINRVLLRDERDPSLPACDANKGPGYFESLALRIVDELSKPHETLRVPMFFLKDAFLLPAHTYLTQARSKEAELTSEKQRTET